MQKRVRSVTEERPLRSCDWFSCSRWRAITKDEVIAEYAESAKLQREHSKLKWGSRESMLNRFTLGTSLIDWGTVNTWVDVGCGTGRFFEHAIDAGHAVKEMVGIDISAEIVAGARRRARTLGINILVGDFQDLLGRIEAVDLVTAIGVLQQCGVHPADALSELAAPLVKEGQLFLTTKNLGWKRFIDGTVVPEPDHSWFRYDEVVRFLERVGIEVTRTGGFLPRENRIVPIADSHTFFVLGRARRRNEVGSG